MENCNCIEKTINDNDSKRITILRFILIFFVIVLHNFFSVENILQYNSDYKENIFVYFIRYLITEGFARSAVPIFVLFAAYIIGKKQYDYKDLIKKRFFSIVLPYLIWTIIYISFYFIIQKISSLKVFFSNSENIVSQWNFIDWLTVFFGYGKNRVFPLVYQFWFLRDLFIMILLTPVLIKFVNKMGLIVILVSFILFLLNIKIYIFDIQVLFFFILGLFFGVNNKSFFDIIDDINIVLLSAIFFGSVVLKYFTVGKNLYCLCRGIEISLSSMLVLKISYYLLRSDILNTFFSYLSGVSFFVYAVHEPIILTMIKKLWISIIGFPNQCMTVIEFIVVPVLTALISVLFAIFLKKLIQPLFKLLNGGR